MFNKILIANRGEIAVRIIRACREMGIQTVAVFSEIDRDALHTQIADEAICIGSAKAADSYLNMSRLLSACIVTGAEAIHPGFGFLSENAKFAEMCADCNIVFIGPDSNIIDMMGNKSNARAQMIAAGVPVVPGSKQILSSVEEAKALAVEVGYPVMIKASAGGGGKGMRIAHTEATIDEAFSTAKMEAKAAFGDDSMYMEKYIEEPRHIEFQIMGDKYGNIVHLGERECSIQRRNQKVLEEAPSAAIDDELRAKMGAMAVKGAKHVGYENAGTMEFLLDKHKNFYFIEMNTRIQVEHPVTEMVTGLDLIKEQIRVAYGEKLSVTQEDVKINGHAIECRINAENTAMNFMPSPGTIEEINLPGGLGVRNDIGVYRGYTIPPTYDSMIGKLIVHAETREEAIKRMRRALGEFIVQGVHTTIDFQYAILGDEDFISGKFDTSFLTKKSF
ncbi:MAG: acetyl-CoA carboxylase biotin carboxylase subunit [Clostridia bacterium]|nr:acetyl-CoA carboxylase biotin carboxylase subunit [Clostridia bacterium]